MFRNLSFRYKIPLRGSALIICTAVVVTTALTVRTYKDLKQDLLVHAASMARVLSHTLTPALLHDDVWRAYEIVNSPFQTATDATFNQTDEIVVLDMRRQVYISNRPLRYPVLSNPELINPDHVALGRALVDHPDLAPTVVEPENSNRFYMVTPIVSDGVRLGTLVIGYSSTVFLPRFINIARSAALITLLALAALLPISWYWGSRMAVPLTQLAGYMGKVSSTLPDDQALKLYESRDEIGQVGVAFRRMLSDLKKKEELEQQIFFSERLAAVGRLAAEIAHEINNPLGGMLNAISTLKKHSDVPPHLAKTILLLERGLLQIKDTIAALLVEARFQSHQLTEQDIEDAHTLVLSNAQSKSVELVWKNAVAGTLALPSTLVRQILINLLLNAIQASEHHVGCEIQCDKESLTMSIVNDGQYIPSERLGYLFEPFTTEREGGNGLGLWVTYQIVQQLKGEIMVKSEPGETRFTVSLPVTETSA